VQLSRKTEKERKIRELDNMESTSMIQTQLQVEVLVRETVTEA
jgi:hypothetical protein